VKEEQKVAALVTGSSSINATSSGLKGLRNCEERETVRSRKNPAAAREIKWARRAMVADRYDQARDPVCPPGLQGDRFSRSTTPTGFGAYLTVSGQNSNNSVSLKDDFLPLGGNRRQLEPIGAPQEDHKNAEGARLWEKIGHGRMGLRRFRLHFNTTMNDWHTCRPPARSRAPNPCSEYCSSTHRLQSGLRNLITFYTPPIPPPQAGG